MRAIAFDAVGTLIHPEPGAIQVYGEVGRRLGSVQSDDQIRTRFLNAYFEQESIDRQNEWRTSESREHERWLAIVRNVFADLPDPLECFEFLYFHFARPDAWRIDADAPALLEYLEKQGFRLALASNYDQRLRPVFSGIEGLSLIDYLIISSEVGWRKPSRQFFGAISTKTGIPPQETLFVGDDLENDFKGATAAGMKAVLVDARRKNPAVFPRVTRLTEVMGLLRTPIS